MASDYYLIPNRIDRYSIVGIDSLQKAVNDIDIFSAKTNVANNIQYGVAGTIPTKYKTAKNDIEAISLELLNRLEKEGE